MGLTIPTTEEIKDTNLSNLESNLNQTSPLNNKAFLRVFAGMNALNFTSLYKVAVEATLQNLALTATDEDLDRIGQEYGVIRKPAEAAILNISLPGENGTVIPASIDYVGDSNNVRYFPAISIIIAGGVGVSDVTANTVGVIGNLNVSDTLSIGTQIAGATTTATVLSVVNTGAEEETDDVYRERVLNAIRSTTGGGNANDHKIWSEEVAGVKQAYPYAGTPTSPAPGIDASSVPADRTVFIEVDTTIDPDGVAPTSILDEVRVSINNDPITGASRPPLGLTDSTLFVESITRTSVNVTITNFAIVDASLEAQTKSDISNALILYFSNISMFVPAIDLIATKNDLVTELTISDVVQDVLTANSASAESVSIDVGGPVTDYQLEEGELAKLGTVTYA